MGSFAVSYVPQADLVNRVKRVDEILKLPYPYFPLKQHNYQKGGMLHVLPGTGNYRAVYVVAQDMEIKAFKVFCNTYNVEDYFSIYIGDRCVVDSSHAKDMQDKIELEVFEPVVAGQEITLIYNNTTGLEKYVLYDIIALVNDSYINLTEFLQWDFSWLGSSIYLGPNDEMTLSVIRPEYINIDSKVSYATITIRDTTLGDSLVCTIDLAANGQVTQTGYTGGDGYLGKVNVIAIIDVTKQDNSINIKFKNIVTDEQQPSHNIEMLVEGHVVNII